MEKQLSYVDAALIALDGANKELSAREIWNKITELGIDKSIDHNTTTPVDNLRKALMRFINSTKKNPIYFRQAEGEERNFGYKKWLNKKITSKKTFVKKEKTDSKIAQYIEMLEKFFKENSYEEVSSLKLKEALKINESGMSNTDWGGLIGNLMQKNYLIKNPTRRERVDGKPIYFYSPGKEILPATTSLNKDYLSKEFLIFDHNGNSYTQELMEAQDISLALKNLTDKYPDLTFTVYKQIGTARLVRKAEINLKIN